LAELIAIVSFGEIEMINAPFRDADVAVARAAPAAKVVTMGSLTGRHDQKDEPQHCDYQAAQDLTVSFQCAKDR